ESAIEDTGPGYLPKEAYRPLRKPDPAAFEENELAVLRSVIDGDGHKTGVQLSAEAHDELAWKCVWQNGEGEGATIPYMLARWEDNRCTAAELAAAAEDLNDPEVKRVLAELTG